MVSGGAWLVLYCERTGATHSTLDRSSDQSTRPAVPHAQGQDFTFATEGGWSFEEWIDGAADRAAKAEEEERAAREAAAREAAAAAKAAALQRDDQEARAAVEGERPAGSHGLVACCDLPY
jgi:hypothetical protein